MPRHGDCGRTILEFTCAETCRKHMCYAAVEGMLFLLIPGHGDLRIGVVQPDHGVPMA